jgi:hypothetical protein
MGDFLAFKDTLQNYNDDDDDEGERLSIILYHFIGGERGYSRYRARATVWICVLFE